MNPILLLEINEVPWRLIDRYINSRQLGRTDISLRLQKVDAQTGYHIPEGVLSVLGVANSQRDISRTVVKSDTVKAWLLAMTERGFEAIQQVSQRPVSSSHA